MKKRIFITVMFLTAVIFISDEAFSAWTQAKGHSYNQLGLSYYKTTKKFTTIENKVNPGPPPSLGEIETVHAKAYRRSEEEFTSTKITYYGEYGITDILTIYTAIPFDWQRSNDNIRYGDDLGPSGIGDVNLGLRYNLTQNVLGTGTLMSVQGETKIPTYIYNADYENPLDHLSLGDGQYDATLLLQFGRGFGKGYGWLNAGYKYRFENNIVKHHSFKPSDQFKVSFGGGYPVTSWLSLTGYIDWFRSVGNAEVSNELVDRSKAEAGIKTAPNKDTAKAELILDSLGLEPNDLNLSVGLQFNITPEIQTVLSYSRDLDGFGYFKTENYALGETFGIALVYLH
ncbi:MAG: hypothetical protein HZB61_08890 [Nitrospirae bacterium]|nr:hypothetical protein [Nitrospirota bacterium]